MSTLPDWLPPIVKLEDFDGNWDRYINKVFSFFYRDFIESQPMFLGKWVRCRRDLIYDGKEAGFWHCTSEGPNELYRIPNIRRCERIGWIKAVIEHCNDPIVDLWPKKQRGEIRQLLWFNEEFMIVLAERQRKRDGFMYMQLITAYCTEQEHRREKLRQERDKYFRSKNG